MDFIIITGSGGRNAAKRQLLVLFYSQAKKINIFNPQGRLIAPIHLKFGMAEETRDSGSAWPCKISRQSVHGVGTRFPKIRKFQLFGRVAPRASP